MKNIDKSERIGYVATNLSGLKMRCVEFFNPNNITVEFEDGYVIYNVQWSNFIRGKVKNRMSITSISKNGKLSKEYYTWLHMLERSIDKSLKDKKPTYKDCRCCKEWLSFDDFNKWLHSQENFQIWKSLKWSALDKDILIKGNKLYSPETCLLVPLNVNTLFVKRDSLRGKYPVGVFFENGKYRATCSDPFLNTMKTIGYYQTLDEAFISYKNYKENIIKQVANIEFTNKTITKKCRDAMLEYKVEIGD